MKSVIKRILGTIPVLIGVVLLIFIMLRIVPGNAAAMLLGEHVDQATIDRLTEVMGLDKPVIVQFFDYLAGAIHGDLGISYKYNRAVTDMIIEAFPYTLELALLAALFAWVLGLGTGIIAAIRQNSLVDHLFMGVSLAGVSMPIFMVALLLQYLFAFKIKAFPLTLDGTFLSMILPAIALGWNSAGSIARMTRSSLLEVMGQDYIRTARAKGLTEFAVVTKHALRNALIPVITVLGPTVAGLLTGSLVVEKIFAIPGIGYYFVNSVTQRDYTTIMGVTIFFAAFLMAMVLLVDIFYCLIDPRIKFDA